MGRDIYQALSNMDIRELTRSIFGKAQADELLNSISTVKSSAKELDYTIVSEETINAIKDILKTDKISATDMENIMTFLIHQICAIEDVPVPNYNFSYIMTDDILNPESDTTMLGEYSGGKLNICLTDSNGKLNSIYDVIDTTFHELLHYFAEEDLKDGIISARAFNSMLTKIFRNNLSTSNYDEYRSNYFTKESESDANKYAARAVITFIENFAPDDEKSKELINQYNKKIITEYVRQAKATPKDIHGDKYPLFEYNVKNLTMIIRRRPYLLHMYPILNEFYELDKEGKLNIRLSNVLKLCAAIEDAYNADAISETTKDDDLEFLDSFIWSCAKGSSFKNYVINSPDEEQQMVRREGIYSSFIRMYEKCMEASYYDKSENSEIGYVTSQILLRNIMIMINMRNAVYAGGVPIEGTYIDISEMDACLENMINYAGKTLDEAKENIPPKVFVQFRDLEEKYRLYKNESLDSSDTRK